MAHICTCKTCGTEIDDTRPSLERHSRLLWKYAELAKIILRISKAHKANWNDELRNAIADGDELLRPDPALGDFLSAEDEAEALSYMDAKAPEQPTT